jgi:uroporphyrinogen III methyltransferase / synthase
MSKAIRPDDSAQKPLSGRRIVVTRARAQAESLARRIEELGGEVIEFPAIEICPPESFAAFDDAVAKIENYDWLIFTSVNSIEPFFARLKQKGKTLASLAALKVGAIGPETAKRLEEFGIHAGLVPERYQAEGILDAVEPETMRGKRVLIPRAAEAREILPETLRGWGASVDVVVAYRTVLPAIDVAPLAKLLRERKIDVVTFTSSSTVRNFARLFGDKTLREITTGSTIACIGPITARTVEQLGRHPDIIAEEFTIPGMMRAIVEYLQTRPDAANKRSGKPAN